MLKLFLGLFLFFVQVSVFGRTTDSEDVECPIDGTKVTFTFPMSYSVFGSKKDFQKFGAIGTLYEEIVSSCPVCHYSGTKDDFHRVFDEKTKKELQEVLKPFKDVEINDVTEHEIAIKIYEYLNKRLTNIVKSPLFTITSGNLKSTDFFNKESNLNIADLYLISSYLLRKDKEKIEKRKETQKNAIIYFTKAIENGEIENIKAIYNIKYLIGDLYRRIGDFDNAIKYYDEVLKNNDVEQNLKELITEQKELALKKDDNNDI